MFNKLGTMPTKDDLGNFLPFLIFFPKISAYRLGKSLVNILMQFEFCNQYVFTSSPPVHVDVQMNMTNFYHSLCISILPVYTI